MTFELANNLIDRPYEVLSPLKIELIGKNSKRIYQDKEHVLLGVSPFNSYFIEEKLVKLIKWALTHFKYINVFVPDRISIFTLMAIGYSAEKAEYKVKKQDRYLKNKVFRAMQQLGLSDMDMQKMLIVLSDLLENTRYQQVYKECLENFEANREFKKGCLSTSSWILANYLQPGQLKVRQLNLAVAYFLKELPLFLDAPAILNVKSSLFVYHTIPQYLQNLYNTSPLVSAYQGCLSINIL